MNISVKGKVEVSGTLQQDDAKMLQALENAGADGVRAIEIMRKLNEIVTANALGAAAVRILIESSNEGPAKTSLHFAAGDFFAERKEELYSKSINTLGLSARASNILGPRWAKIQTIGELCSKSEMDLLKCRNLGRTTLQEIQGKLKALGLELAPDKICS